MNNDTFQYVEKLNPEMQRYMDCMTDIKQRWWYIRSRLKSLSFKCNKTNVESTCLQFRMIIELIFLSNYSSHEAVLEKLLCELVEVWKISDVIKQIEKINPNYYPVLIKLIKKQISERPEADGEIQFLKSPLSKEDALQIYSDCSGFLHPRNAFRKEKNYQQVFNKFNGWHQKIKMLLASHAIQLADKKLKIFCLINFDELGVKKQIQVGFTHKLN